MKLSENTITVLKNFSGINTGLVLKPGKKQSSIAISKHVMAEVEITEEIPVEFGIFDLPAFISNLNYFKDGELEFDKDKCIMSSGTGVKMTFYASAPSLIMTPTKRLPDFEPVAVFKLSHETLTKAIALANVNSLAHLLFVGSNGKVSLRVTNEESSTSNTGEFPLGDYQGATFKAVFKVENLKLLPVDYTVSVNDNAFAKFSGDDGKVVYFIALQSEEK